MTKITKKMKLSDYIIKRHDFLIARQLRKISWLKYNLILIKLWFKYH
jgi:hypothetical protein